jgi:hypothetical protein
VVGVAQGQAAGNALNWRYTLLLPVDGKVYEMQFDDWMYLMDDRVMLNKAVMSKFGIRLGEVTAVLLQACPADPPEPKAHDGPEPPHHRLARPHRLAGGRLHRHRPRHGGALHALGAKVTVSGTQPAGAGRLRRRPPRRPATPAAGRHRPRRRARCRGTSIVADDGRIDLALYCAGTYTPCAPPSFDLDVALRHVQVNYVGRW